MRLHLPELALLTSLAVSAAPLLEAQKFIAPNDGEHSDSYAAPAMQGSSSGRTYAANIGSVRMNSGAFFRYTTGDDIRGTSIGTEDVVIREYGLFFNGVVDDFASFSYSPSWESYSGSRYSDEFSQRFSGDAGFKAGSWDISIGQDYVDSSSIDTESARQTDQERWRTDLGGSYQLNSSLSAGVGASFSKRDSEGFNSAESTIFRGSLAKQILTSGSASLSVAKGYDDTNTGFEADLTQYSGHFGYQPSELVYVSTMLGKQKRSFNIVGAPDLSSTVFSVALNFSPAEFTRVSIRSDSNLSASIFSNQTRKNETVRINLTQRLFDLFILGLSYGVTDSEYLAARESNEPARSDEYEFFDARLGWDFRQNTAVSIFYREQENRSDLSLFGYEGAQRGIEVRVSF